MNAITILEEPSTRLKTRKYIDSSSNSTGASEYSVRVDATVQTPISLLSSHVNEMRSLIGVIEIFSEISKATGEDVILRQVYDYFPVLVGNDKKPIPLFEFVEILDETIDYEIIKEELPTLSYTQIYNAISFLRKISSVNIRGIDIDEAEELFDEEDEKLISELKKGFEDKEIKRVLYQDKCNS